MRVRAIVGPRGSGKTLLAEGLAADLTAHGHRVAYVRQVPVGVEPSEPASDVARLTAVGAKPCLFADDEGRLYHPTSDRSASITGTLATGLDAGLVLLEGFDDSDWPKIRVRAARRHRQEDAGGSDSVLCEIARGESGFAPSQIEIARQAVIAAVPVPDDPEVTVIADGIPIPVRGFAARAVAATVMGVCSSLTGVDQPTNLSVTVRGPSTSRSTQAGVITTGVMTREAGGAQAASH